MGAVGAQILQTKGHTHSCKYSQVPMVREFYFYYSAVWTLYPLNSSLVISIALRPHQKSLCSRWWLMEKLTTGHNADAKRMDDVQPEIEHLYMTIPPKFRDHLRKRHEKILRARGQERTRTELLYS